MWHRFRVCIISKKFFFHVAAVTVAKIPLFLSTSGSLPLALWNRLWINQMLFTAVSCKVFSNAGYLFGFTKSVVPQIHCDFVCFFVFLVCFLGEKKKCVILNKHHSKCVCASQSSTHWHLQLAELCLVTLKKENVHAKKLMGYELLNTNSFFPLDGCLTLSVTS